MSTKTHQEISWESLNSFLNSIPDKYSDRVEFDIDIAPVDNDGDYDYTWNATLENTQYKKPIEIEFKMRVKTGLEENVYYVEMGEEWERVSEWDNSISNLYWVIMWGLWDKINELEEEK